MLQYLETLAYWDWFIAGLVLVILEIFAPGAVFLWLGIAAGVVGAVVFFAPYLDWKFQFTLFAVLSVVSIVVSRRYLKRRPLETDHPNLNRRGAQYVGRELILDAALSGGGSGAGHREDSTSDRSDGAAPLVHLSGPHGSRDRCTLAGGAVVL